MFLLLQLNLFGLVKIHIRSLIFKIYTYFEDINIKKRQAIKYIAPIWVRPDYRI